MSPSIQLYCLSGLLDEGPLLGGVKSACKDPSFAISLIIFANQTWQLPEWPFQTLTYMFYNLPLQIQTIQGALQYKIAPLTPPNSHSAVDYISFLNRSFFNRDLSVPNFPCQQSFPGFCKDLVVLFVEKYRLKALDLFLNCAQYFVGQSLCPFTKQTPSTFFRKISPI